MFPTPTRRALARMIDHTVLKPETTLADVAKLCDECVQCGFFAACVNPYWVRECVRRLAGSGVCVASVAGFPLGATSSESKAAEARIGVGQGAGEIDMVLNLGALVGGDLEAVRRDVAGVCDAVRQANAGALVKVILETRALTTEQIVAACKCCVEAGAHFLKTSTGFHAAGGASVEHVALLKKHAGGLKVKASGGIRDLPTALALIDAGADRLGMSASVAVVNALPE
ncbi:MAG: deoxyribose-phosphate aldolase [Phycisphaerae bacterium]